MIPGWARRVAIILVSLAAVLLPGSSFARTGAPTGVMVRRLVDSPLANVGGFSASLFKFKTIVEDDGTGKGGGWQQADAKLNFVDSRSSITSAWTCTLTIEMPLRTELKGKISAEKAAEWSAQVATQASSEVMHTKEGWVPAEFCNAWREKMKAIFKEEPYKGIGVRISA